MNCHLSQFFSQSSCGMSTCRTFVSSLLGAVYAHAVLEMWVQIQNLLVIFLLSLSFKTNEVGIQCSKTKVGERRHPGPVLSTQSIDRWPVKKWQCKRHELPSLDAPTITVVKRGLATKRLGHATDKHQKARVLPRKSTGSWARLCNTSRRLHGQGNRSIASAGPEICGDTFRIKRFQKRKRGGKMDYKNNFQEIDAERSAFPKDGGRWR